MKRLASFAIVFFFFLVVPTDAQFQRECRYGFCNSSTTLVFDPFWTSVKLLMGFNGSNGSTGAPGMTDESSAAHGTATVAGGPQISTAQSVFGGSSILFSANGNITFPDSADFDLSNQSFTLEMRFRPASISGGISFLIDQWTSPNNGWALYQNNATLNFDGSTTGSNDVVIISVASALTLNTWIALCVDFDGTKYRMYKDGVMIGSSTSTMTFFNSASVLDIGNNPGAAFFLNGNIDELRYTKGVARYASDGGYTVATAQFPRQ